MSFDKIGVDKVIQEVLTSRLLVLLIEVTLRQAQGENFVETVARGTMSLRVIMNDLGFGDWYLQFLDCWSYPGHLGTFWLFPPSSLGVRLASFVRYISRICSIYVPPL